MEPKVVLSKLVLMNHYHWIFPFSENQFIFKILTLLFLMMYKVIVYYDIVI
jgi:hypothetical protein